MSSLPMRRPDLQLHGFISFLSDSGAEIGKPTNQYEVIRYRYFDARDKKAATNIIYRKENDRLTFTGRSKEHYHQFMQGKPLNAGTAKPKAKSKTKTTATREKLLKRDGPDCWFCGVVMGDDCTIEHLIPKSRGGRNSLANYALAHAKCNQKAANIPLVEKMKLREKLSKEAAQ